MGHSCVCSVAPSCPTLCDPMDCSPPGSSVHGIFQARILEWVAISYSRKLPLPSDQTDVSWTGRWVFYHRAVWEALWYIHTLGYIADENKQTYMERAHKDNVE